MTHQNHSEDISSWKILFWIVFSFIIWLYCFRGFMTGFLKLESDAVGYYQHNKFFIDNLCRGVYPLWDPGINGGVPNEFFLRRMGSFNPFFLIIVALRKIGITHLIAYNIYLAVYFFLGAVGFYHLAKRILKNTSSAYLAYLLFLFSSLGTRQFDSYIILVSVPLIWFFYFLIAFTQKPQKYSLLGLIFCLMNLATTYIPLYFAVIGGSFAIFSLMIFPKEIYRSFSQCIPFILKNKILVILGVAALIVSMIPAVMIFKSAKNAEFVMPMRGSGANSSHALAVGKKTVTEWALLEEIVYTKAFTDLKKFKFAIIYIPGVIYLFLLLGFMARMNRKLLLLFVWGGFLFLLSVPGLTPVYEFFHKHVFIFKYFRNLHWFFWLAILPIFILFVVEQFRQVMLIKIEKKASVYYLLAGVTIIHIVFGLFVYQMGNTIVSTYICIGLSMLFLTLIYLNIIPQNSQWIFVIVTLFVSMQAVEVYGYLQKNTTRRNGSLYKGDIPYDPKAFKHSENPQLMHPQNLYYALKPYSDVFSKMDRKALFGYQNDKYVLYDQVNYMDPIKPNYSLVEAMFKTKRNVAYVGDQIKWANNPMGGQYQSIQGNSDSFQVKQATVDSVTIETDFKFPKFLVVNNVYHRYWQAKLNGTVINIIPTNLAFQGIMLSKGKNVLHLQYGSGAYRLFNYTLLWLFYLVFGMIVYFWISEYRLRRDKSVSHEY